MAHHWHGALDLRAPDFGPIHRSPADPACDPLVCGGWWIIPLRQPVFTAQPKPQPSAATDAALGTAARGGSALALNGADARPVQGLRCTEFGYIPTPWTEVPCMLLIRAHPPYTLGFSY